MRGTSVGWLKLRSANPRDHPVLQPNYLSTGNSPATFAWASGSLNPIKSHSVIFVPEPHFLTHESLCPPSAPSFQAVNWHLLLCSAPGHLAVTLGAILHSRRDGQLSKQPAGGSGSPGCGHTQHVSCCSCEHTPAGRACPVKTRGALTATRWQRQACICIPRLQIRKFRSPV